MLGLLAPRLGQHAVDSSYSWLVAAGTLVLASLSFGAVTSVPILFAPIARDFGWSYGLVASVHTLTMICAGAGSIYLGRLLDRRGFFVIAVCAALATSTGLVLASHAASFWQIALAYGLLVGGVGQGAFFSPLAAAVTHWFDRHRSLAVAIALSGQSVGGLLVPPLLRVTAEHVGWRNALQSYGIVCGVGMLAAALLYAPRPPAERRSRDVLNPAEPGAASRRGRSLRVLSATLWCSNTATFGIAGHMVSYGEQVGLGPAAAGSIMAALFGITLFSRLGVGHWLAGGGIYRMMVGSSLLHALGAWLVLTASSPWHLVLAVIVVGLGFGGYLPSYGALVRNMFPAQEAGRRLSELYLLGFLGAGSGTWIVGALRDARGGAFDWSFLAMAFLASTACALLIARRRSFMPLEGST
ncbi:MAG TPA: MFS transporter [Rhodocyclaceae bacterium]|nr:MFS transporter [Rhodocyclaceae bacterium]